MAQSSRFGAQASAHHVIQLTIIEGERLRIFQLSTNDERVVTVGSAPGADIQFDADDVSPIHFYFERLANEVWIVPAYCISGLRVNRANISAPQKLRSRSQLVFGKNTLEVEIAPPQSDNTEISSGVHSDIGSPSDASSRDDDEPTRQVWATTGTSIQTSEFDGVPIGATLPVLPPRILTLIEKPPVLPKDVSPSTLSDADHESPLITASGTPPPHCATNFDTARTVQISRVCAISNPMEHQNPSLDSPASASFRLPLPSAEVPSLKKTLYGVSPTLFGTDNARLVAQSARRRGTRVLETRAIPVHSPQQVRPQLRRNVSLITRLGRVARRKPVFVVTLAITSALLGALLVIAITSAIMQKRGGPLNLGLHELSQEQWVPTR